MRIVRRLRNTRLGVWLRKRPSQTALGALVRAAWTLNKALDAMLSRRRPDHRAHDRRQDAVLTAFVQDTARRQADGPERS
jgi:hypothetical protein